MKLNISKRLESIIRRSEDENEIILQLKQLISEYEKQNNPAKISKTISELFAENIQDLQSNKKENNLIKSGFSKLDERIGGFMPGELIIIGGRPAMGKTQLLINICINIAKTIPVLYFTFDLSVDNLTKRFISTLSNLAIDKILQNSLSEIEKHHITAETKKLGELKLYINDSCSNSISAFKELCIKQINEFGVKVILVDYLQMMGSDNIKNSRKSELNYICRELKNVAKEFNVVVISLSHLSSAIERRTGLEGKKPMLSDLIGSDSIEKEADKVIFIHRPEYYHLTEDCRGNSLVGIVELIIAKNKAGTIGDVLLERDDDFTTFINFKRYLSDFKITRKRLNTKGDLPSNLN
ncbi:MAG TPA: DnaB-like helicase C-terminal domain-containing protein [Candidatus Paceibacterota bacterium]